MLSPPAKNIVSKSTMNAAALHKSHIAKALHRLSELASQANVMVELALCHGTVIAVTYSREQFPIFAVRPNDIAIRLAETIYMDQRLRHDWLETDVAAFMSEGTASHTLHAEDFAPGVRLSVNSSANVLARKLHLLRAPLPPDSTDARDVEFLLGKIKVSSPDQIQHIYARAFPADSLSDTAHQIIDRVLRARAASPIRGKHVLTAP
jgi:hypothetical protein